MSRSKVTWFGVFGWTITAWRSGVWGDPPARLACAPDAQRPATGRRTAATRRTAAAVVHRRVEMARAIPRLTPTTRNETPQAPIQAARRRAPGTSVQA